MEKKYKIYTDGGCHGNPGPGGWAYVLLQHEAEIRSDAGSDPATTNNRMELTAVIAGLTAVRELDPAAVVEVVTDSQYVKNGISSWINTWVRNGWKTSAKKPVKNRDLWMQLHELNSAMHTAWSWVRGHAGDHYNEICDQMVQEAIQK